MIGISDLNGEHEWHHHYLNLSCFITYFSTLTKWLRSLIRAVAMLLPLTYCGSSTKFHYKRTTIADACNWKTEQISDSEGNFVFFFCSAHTAANDLILDMHFTDVWKQDIYILVCFFNSCIFYMHFKVSTYCLQSSACSSSLVDMIFLAAHNWEDWVFICLSAFSFCLHLFLQWSACTHRI